MYKSKTSLVVAIILTITLLNIECKKFLPGYVVGSNAVHEKHWVVTTVAGNGEPYFADGPVTSAEFRAPLDVAVAGDGTIYIADAINHRIRKIADGQVTTLVGGTVADTTSGDWFLAKFMLPSHLAIDKDNNLYTLDVEDPRVRKISSGFVSVIAGNGVNGFAEGQGDTAAFGKECSGITIDQDGTIYVVDWKNRRVRKIAANGYVSTVAGNGKAGFVNGTTNAEFFNPAGIVIDKHGNLFVGDWNRIRKIAPDGTVSTLAGKESVGYKDGPANEALFSDITDLVIDENDNIFISDENRIRKITQQGIVSTIAGSTGGYADGSATEAKFLGPVGLAIDKCGNIYVADDHNNRIRKISYE